MVCGQTKTNEFKHELRTLVRRWHQMSCNIYFWPPQSMNVWPNACLISMIFIERQKNPTHFSALFSLVLRSGFTLLTCVSELLWIWRRELSTAAVCASAGHMISAWLLQSPPPWIPRGEKVIAIIALPWHGAEHPEVREKDHWKDDVSELIKKDWFAWSSTMVNCVRPIPYPACVNEWIYIVSAEADFCVKYSPFVSRDSVSCSDGGAQDEDKCLCIILYSLDGMSDIVPVPSLVQNGCSRPQTQWLCLTLPKTLGTPTFV